MINIRGEFALFADDTTLLWNAENTSDLKTIIAEDLAKVREWCDSNLLSLNMSEIKLLDSQYEVDRLAIGNKYIDNEQQLGFAAVIMDGELRFEYHITVREKAGLCLLCCQS